LTPRWTDGEPPDREKIRASPRILDELGLDAWMLFARESATVHDPSFDLVVGTNVTWHSAFLLTRTGERIAVDRQPRRANVECARPLRRDRHLRAGDHRRSAQRPRRLDPKRIAINYSVNDAGGRRLTHGHVASLTGASRARPTPAASNSAERVVAALRGRKTDAERGDRRGVRGDRRHLRGGHLVSAPASPSKQFAAMIVEEMERSRTDAGVGREHCPAVFTGPDSAGAHAGPTDRPIEPGHIVNVGLRRRRTGYCSDLQRTWYVLRPGETQAPDAVQRGFDTILKSIRDARRVLSPARPGAEIDDVARGVVTPPVTTSTPTAPGHQIGRVAHDGGAGLLPRWERYGDTPHFRSRPGSASRSSPR
jgi:Xaa-Pro aminopeptidase